MKSKEIARILGVSEATVSLVRNNRPGVGDELRKKILDMLGKQPEDSQQSLSQKKRLCYVNVYRRGQQAVQSLDPSPHFHSLMDVISQRAIALGYELRVMFLYPEQQSLAEIVRACEAENAAGIFISDVLGLNSDYSDLKRANVPVLFFDQDAQAQGFDCSIIDNRTAAGLVVGALLNRGCSRILYVQSPESCYNLIERRLGFAESMALQGLPNDAQTRFVWQNDGSDVLALSRRIAEFLPTAILVEGSGQLMPALSAIRQSGQRPGKDILLSCCDGVYNTVAPDMEIISINYGHIQQMEAAMMLMDARLRGMAGNALKIVVKPELRLETAVY